MARKSEMTFLVILARMRTFSHELGHLAQVRIQDGRAIQLDLDRGTLHGYLLVVPLARGAQVAAVGRDHAIGRTMVLASIKPGILGMFGIEYL